MKLTILGRSGGFPMPGEATSGYLLQAAGKNILLDCGSGVLSGLLRFIPVEKLDLLILSHLHQDHVADLGVLKYAINMSRRVGMEIPDLPVYLPTGPDMLHPGADGILAFTHIEPGIQVEWEDLTLTFVPGEHPVECYAARIQAEGKIFAYTGDTRMCDRVDDMVRDADLAVMDAGSLERRRTPDMVHMTARECAEAAVRASVKRPVLSHIVPFNDEAETLREAAAVCDRIEVARPLGEYDI